MNKTETEILLESIDTTLDEVTTIVKNCVAWKYKTMPQLWGYETVEDMSQKVLVYLLSTMKSTGDIRLNHYIKKYNDKKHILNLIRQSALQLPLYTLRSAELKHKPLSFQIELPNNGYDSADTLLDILIDEKASTEIENRLFREDFMQLLIDELNKANFYILKSTATNTELPFLFDTTNYVKICNRTKTQLAIIQDLYNGYKKKELAQKYSNFKDHLAVVKQVLSENKSELLRTR